MWRGQCPHGHALFCLQGAAGPVRAIADSAALLSIITTCKLLYGESDRIDDEQAGAYGNAQARRSVEAAVQDCTRDWAGWLRRGLPGGRLGSQTQTGGD